MPDLTKPGRRELLLSRLRQLLGSSTAHGVNKLVQQDTNWTVRVIWFTIFVSAVCGVTLHTATVIRLYFSYPVSSTVRQEVNGFEFPDVTICDTMLKKFFLYNVSHYDRRTEDRAFSRFSQVVQTMLGYQFGWESKKFLKATYTASGHMFNMSEVSARAQDFVLYCEFDQKPCSHNDFVLYYDKEYGNCYTFQPASRQLEKAGAEMGLIMVLYPPSVDANFEEDRIMKTATGLESKGFQVTVHQRNTRPDPHEFGITAPVGMRTDFALSQAKIRLANTNTRPCAPAGVRRFWNPFLRLHQEYEDRLYSCVENEDALSLLRTCRCTIEGLIPAEEKRLLQADYCHDILDMRHFNSSRFARVSNLVLNMWRIFSEERKRKYAALIVKVIGAKIIEKFPDLGERLNRAECAYNFSQKQSLSLCLNECQYSEYSSAIALAEWPDRTFASRGSLIRIKKLGSMLADYISVVANLTPPAALVTSLGISNRNVSSCREDIHPNYDPAALEDTDCTDLQRFVSNTLVQVRVYPKTLTVRLLIEERSYELEKLFSDIGGILGLWVGISVITIFELAEIAVLSAAFLYNLINKPGGANGQQQPPNSSPTRRVDETHEASEPPQRLLQRRRQRLDPRDQAESPPLLPHQNGSLLRHQQQQQQQLQPQKQLHQKQSQQQEQLLPQRQQAEQEQQKKKQQDSQEQSQQQRRHVMLQQRKDICLNYDIETTL